MTETETEPQDWEGFRATMAGAMRAAGYDDVATFSESAESEEGIIAPLLRLWEQVQFDPPNVDSDPREFWGERDEAVRHFLTQFAEEYSSRWNWEPGDKPESLDTGKFGREVTMALVMGEVVHESPNASGILMEGPMSEGTDSSDYDETGAPEWNYFRMELAKHLKKHSDFEYLVGILVDVDYMGDTQHSVLQQVFNSWDASNDEWKYFIESGELEKGDTWWSTNEGILSDMVIDVGMDMGIDGDDIQEIAFDVANALETEHKGMPIPNVSRTEEPAVDEEEAFEEGPEQVVELDDGSTVKLGTYGKPDMGEQDYWFEVQMSSDTDQAAATSAVYTAFEKAGHPGVNLKDIMPGGAGSGIWTGFMEEYMD